MSARPAAGGAAAPNGKQPSEPYALGIPDAVLDELAARVAAAIVERMPEPVEPYMDAERAAEYLACPKSRIYELVAAGRLRHYRDGRRVLLRREDLDAVLRVEELR